MAGEWHRIQLREANVALIDCDHRTPRAADVGYPYVAIPQLRNGRIDLSDVRRISREQFLDWTRKAKPICNDVVLSRRCNPGETAFVPPNLEFALGQNLVLLRADGTRVYPPFLRWLVRGPEWWEQIGKFLNVGAVFDSLRCADVPSFQLLIPPLDEQRAIAHVLGTLDDKIELNRRMNETHEAMARALFKSWFVDFDPVRAKAEDRHTGLPRPVADLFPDSFEDSVLGEIPKGWNAAPLGALLKIGIGGAWGEDEPSKRATVRTNCLRGIDCHELAEGRTPEVPIRWLSEKQVADRAVTNGTILIEGSGSFCGRSLLWDSSFHRLIAPPVSYSNFCKRLDPLCTTSQAAVCWVHMRNAYRTGELNAFRTGTAFPNLDVHGMLSSVLVALPPEPVADAFAKLLGSTRRTDLMAQSVTLAILRDTLLSKLISGELLVKNAERCFAGVVP